MTPTSPTSAEERPRGSKPLDRVDGLHPAWRLAVGLTITATLGFTAFAAFFLGVFATTGCFISCSEPLPVGGAVAAVGALVAVVGGWFLRSVLVALLTGLVDAARDLPRTVRWVLIGFAVVGDTVWVLSVAAWSTCADGAGGCDLATLLGTEGLWLAGGWTAAAGAGVVVLTGNARSMHAWVTAAGVAAISGVAAVLT